MIFKIPVSVFLIKTKVFPFSGLFTNSRQHYTLKGISREIPSGGGRQKIQTHEEKLTTTEIT